MYVMRAQSNQTPTPSSPPTTRVADVNPLRKEGAESEGEDQSDHANDEISTVPSQRVAFPVNNCQTEPLPNANRTSFERGDTSGGSLLRSLFRGAGSMVLPRECSGVTLCQE